MHLLLFEYHAFEFVKKKKLNERMPELPAATTAPPQEHAVGAEDSWHPKIVEGGI